MIKLVRKVRCHMVCREVYRDGQFVGLVRVTPKRFDGYTFKGVDLLGRTMQGSLQFCVNMM